MNILKIMCAIPLGSLLFILMLLNVSGEIFTNRVKISSHSIKGNHNVPSVCICVYSVDGGSCFGMGWPRLKIKS